MGVMMGQVDHRGGDPSGGLGRIRDTRDSLVLQTTERLRQVVLERIFPIGSKLPPEPELAAQLGISRATLRAALANLARSGLLIRRRGIGTFVSRLALFESNLPLTSDIAETIASMGYEPGLAGVNLSAELATSELAERLACGLGASLVRLTRIRTADGRPVIHEVDLFPEEFLSRGHPPVGRDGFLRAIKTGTPLYHLFAEQLAVYVAHGIAELKPVVADRAMARLLAAKVGDPLLFYCQSVYDERHVPVCFSAEHYLPEFCTFTIHRGP